MTCRVAVEGSRTLEELQKALEELTDQGSRGEQCRGSGSKGLERSCRGLRGSVEGSKGAVEEL